MDGSSRIGAVTLIVNDLPLCLDYYTNSIGLNLVSRADSSVALGVSDTVLLNLEENKTAARVKPSTGLYHVAYLLPSRADLARQLRHFAAQGVPLQGMSDHQVSEALYLSDPEGNGIEIYRDRPRDDWNWVDGEVVMTTDPLDVDAVLGMEDRASEPWEGMPKGTVIGHVHLRVSDLAEAEKFYTNVLGMAVTTHSYRGAVFLSVDGYHHHIGVNTWGSAGAPAMQTGTAGLKNFVFNAANQQEWTNIRDRAEAAGAVVSESHGTMELRDPFGIVIQVVVNE